jgi:hypothetical protein
MEIHDDAFQLRRSQEGTKGGIKNPSEKEGCYGRAWRRKKSVLT